MTTIATAKPLLDDLLEKRAIRWRKPCIDCGGQKGPGRGRRLCPSCQGPDLIRARRAETQTRTRRDRHYWNRYRIRLADYERMLEQQGFVCAICKGQQSVAYRYFDVDHDAKTGRVRGLLCRRCNLVVGLAELGILDAARAYLLAAANA